MRSSSLLLVTFILWLAGKGKLKTYWEFATVSAAGSSSPVAAAGAGNVVNSALPVNVGNNDYSKITLTNA